MRKWIVRFGSLLVFNIVVLLLIGFFTPARVGWAALWGAVVLTILMLVVKPIVQRLFASFAARKPGDARSRIGEKATEFVVTYAVAFVIWAGVVLLSSVRVGGGVLGFLLGYLLPPLILMLGFAVYDVIDDRVEARAGALYDRATGGRVSPGPTAPPIPSAPREAGRRELRDGLTDEQRRMLDGL